MHSAKLSGDSPQIGSDNQYFYEYVWSYAKASGSYIAGVKGKTNSTTLKGKVKFAVVR